MKFTHKIALWLAKRQWKEIKKMADKENKSWYRSKGAMGSLVTIVVSMAGFFGIVGLAGETEAITDNLILLITGVSGFVGLIGRLVATAKLTK